MTESSEHAPSIGIFDSGIGGLLVMRYIVKLLPEYNYVYFGDTLRMPYGERSEEEVYELAKSGIEFLFNQGCHLVIVACNSISAGVLRRIQQDFLPSRFPERKVLGVLIPIAEEAIARGAKHIGVLATPLTVQHRAYTKELKKIDNEVLVFEQSAPRLAEIIENNAIDEIEEVLKMYLALLLHKNIDTLILGCTHYPLIRNMISEIIGDEINIICPSEAVPKRLAWYLHKHPKIDSQLGKSSKQIFIVSQRHPRILTLAKDWFGNDIDFHRAEDVN